MSNLLMSNFGNGLFTFILGMIVVFLGMFVIVIAVSLVGKVMSKTGDKKQPENPEKQVEPVPVVANVKHEVDGEIPEHVRVAIIAAIAAYYENNQPQNEFIVKKIKKLNR